MMVNFGIDTGGPASDARLHRSRRASPPAPRRRRTPITPRASRRGHARSGVARVKRRRESCWLRRQRRHQQRPARRRGGARLDAGRADAVFEVGEVGYRGLLRPKRPLDGADISMRPRRDGPDGGLPEPQTPTLALPRRTRRRPTVNVDRPAPFFEQSDEPPPPGPASDAGQAGEHEARLPLNRRVARGPPSARSRAGPRRRRRRQTRMPGGGLRSRTEDGPASSAAGRAAVAAAPYSASGRSGPGGQ